MSPPKSSDPCLCNHGQNTLLDEYAKWMITYRSSSMTSVKKHRRYLTLFFAWLNTKNSRIKLASLSYDKVEEFYLNYCSDHGAASREQMRSVLRVFLRFCFSKKYVKQDLSIAVPTIRTYRLATIPHGISEEDIDRILSRIDRHNKAGLRDYAIIQLLRVYGVRSKQIRTLCLNDINWRENEIYFNCMKHGKDVRLPLTPDVGMALLDYLQHGRPQCELPEVFLHARPPFRPFTNPSRISEIVNRRAHEAGLSHTRVGPHMFRHAFATRMLHEKHTLKSIADMMGHRRLQTTYIYTKVDFQTLNLVALEWPEER